MTKMVHRPAPSHDAGDSRGEAKASTTEARLVEKLCLRNHKDQVWDVCFSNDGTRLASSGADKTTVIYQLDSFEVVHVLSGHSGGIANASWSPDDSKIVTCSQDNTARVWDTTVGKPLQIIDGFDAPVTSCSWLPDGQSFVTTSLDSSMSVCLWSISGTLIYKFTFDDPMVPILGGTILAESQKIVSFDNQKHVYVHGLESKLLARGSCSDVDLSSMCASKLGKPYVLFLRTDGLIEMVDVTSMKMVKVFKMNSNGHFIIKATFGGKEEEFVASGNEDGAIYVWNTGTGELLAKQRIHTVPTSCNCVAWNPKKYHIIATAGDDHTVRILNIDDDEETWVHVDAVQEEATA